jgi:hypothetical protein
MKPLFSEYDPLFELPNEMHGSLVDAHRHGLYDLAEWSLRGTPVHTWEQNMDFIKHEKRTKQLFGSDLQRELREWTLFSQKEGVGSVLDFSGKHDRLGMAQSYQNQKIENYSPCWWAEWHDNIYPPARAMILPDEREVNERAAKRACEFLAFCSEGFITLHAQESEWKREIGQKRFGSSLVFWLHKQGLLGIRTILVHMNIVDENDVELLVHTRTPVVLCPASRLALKNPNPQLPPEVELHFGTDSSLVSGERSLLEQARLQRRIWVEAGCNFGESTVRALRALSKKLPGSKS